MRSLINCPASGAAVTVVLKEALGGGVGELVRKRGWMCSSLVRARELRREKLRVVVGGLPGEGGGKRAVKLGISAFFELVVGDEGGELGCETGGCGRGDLGGVGEEGKKGPSRAFAGEGEREPGIGASGVGLRGGLEAVSRFWSAAWISLETEEVSQASKPES